MYVRVLIEQGVDSDAISLPEQAIQRNGGGGAEVFVVKDDNRAAVQPVRLGPAQAGHWLVLDGFGFHQAYFKTEQYVNKQYQEPECPWPTG